MTKQYDDTNRFSLFPSDRMRDDRDDPDLTGYINIDGKEYWFNAWTKRHHNGDIKVISGVIGEERQRQQNQDNTPQSPAKRSPNRSGGTQGANKSTRR